VYSQALNWKEYDDADAWWNAIETLLRGASKTVDLPTIQSICVSGTSASCLLVDRDTQKWTRYPRMYNYDVVEAGEDPEAATRALQLLDTYAPPRHTARARTGSLAKLVTWALEKPLLSNESLCHQSDYISMLLTGQTAPMQSDWHNCLKLGYDVRQREWPQWLLMCLQDVGISDPATVIPWKVVAPGEQLGVVDPSMAERLGLSQSTVIVGGTTDSNAAFFAAAGTSPPSGTAVTSLGSTLAMKQLSEVYVEDADRGVYSHRFPNFQNPDDEAWLVGGASNVGCAILRQLGFSNDELKEISARIDPATDSPLNYYPLTRIGERFPIADPGKEPLLEPVPESRTEYLHGLLQSIGDIEREGFSVLQELGAPPPAIVYTCGGGSNNEMWNQLRQRRLRERFSDSEITVKKAECIEASFGAALLAAATFQ
jgi:D-ribulokinase